LSTPEYDRGWNDAVKLAYDQIKSFALSSGLDAESSAYQCNLIVENLLIDPIPQVIGAEAKEIDPWAWPNCRVCPKCMSVHGPEEDCLILGIPPLLDKLKPLKGAKNPTKL
jgi:hypothetical protein